MTILSRCSYSVRFSSYNDADEIYNFYASEGRPKEVYLRNKSVISERVEAGYFLCVRQIMNGHEGKIIAAAAMYPLADGMPIYLGTQQRLYEKAVVWELGSVLRRRTWEVPTQECIENLSLFNILVALPVLTSFLRADAEVDSVETLVAEVFSHRTSIINRFMAAPFFCGLIRNVSSDVFEAMDETINGDGQNNLNTFLRFLPYHLPDVAAAIHDKMVRDPVTGAVCYQAGGALIDMSHMPAEFLDMLPRLVEHADLFKRELAPDVSFRTARAAFERYMPVSVPAAPALARRA